MPTEQNSGEPQAGTPETTPAPAATTPTPQAGDGTDSISLEEARKLRAEASSLRKRLKGYEEAEQAAREAALTEAERSSERLKAIEARAKQYQQELVNAKVAMAAKERGIIDPELAALAIQKDLELDEEGMPSNLDKVLDTLAKNKPYLVKKPAEPAPATPAQTAHAPAVPAMNPGRSSISSPNAFPPGKIPTLHDINWSK